VSDAKAGPRAVLFDAAGTLIAPSEPVGRTYARIAGGFGARVTAQALGDAFACALAAAPAMVFPLASDGEVEALERDWWRDVVRSTFRGAGVEPSAGDFDACFDALFEAFARPSAWSERSGASSALARLRERGCATGVVSNFDRRLHGILAGLGLAPLLDVVVLPSDARAEKPDPAIFALALERLGIGAHAAVFVGDHPEEDVLGARRAGLRAIDVATLATLRELPDRLFAAHPEATTQESTR
jgi:putative hydrolase of the HAD superfamily